MNAVSARTARTAFGLIVVGAAAYVVLPRMALYFDNQNTKFLFGMAKADVGRLADDWLIAQGSSLPIFDAMVFWSYAILGEFGFHVWHFMFVVAYTIGIYVIASRVNAHTAGGQDDEYIWFLPVFGICWLGLNSNYATLKAFEGFAGQYINGVAFEPQYFGVLCLIGLALFRIRQTGWAVLSIVIAAWVHPVFSISGLMLIVGMAVAKWRFGGEVSLPPLTTAAGVFGCLAAAGFAYSLLQPSDPAIQAEATRILTEVRIPWHSLPERWVDDSDTVIKFIAVVVAVWVARRDPLSVVIAVVVACIGLSTLWVYLTRDAQLALAAPWRASSIVVPGANAILLGWLIRLAAGWCQHRLWLSVASIIAIVAVMAVGVGLGQRARAVSLLKHKHPSYYAWVREHAREGDVFLTEVSAEDFRLATGQPQYVSWKTHPYRGESVLEWYERLQKADTLVGAEQVDCKLLEEVSAEGVTHLVRPSTNGDTHCPGWRVIYDDRSVAISSNRP